MSALHVPDIAGSSFIASALAYAEAGFFVLPVAHWKHGKHPGSIVGKGWPEKSSTDPEQIEDWWDSYPDASIAIHTGPSGLTFFDLDIDVMPEELAWLRTGIVQFSRAESVNSERGHYGFFTGDEIFTSGDLKLADGSNVGEIRSGNTVVIASPSVHPNAATKNGQYLWRPEDVRTPIPKLPSEARSYLRLLGEKKRSDGTHTAMAGWGIEATDESVKEANALWCNNIRPKSLTKLANSLRRAKAGTRNQTRDALRIAACEARIGFYPMADVISEIRAAMIASYNNRTAPEKFDDGEFWRLVKNGVGYAMTRDLDEISAEANRDYGPRATGDDFESAVTQQIRKLEVFDEAKRRLRAKNHVPLSRPITNLTAFLAEPPNPTPMRIDNLMPDGGRVVFSAPYKAGKTTAVGNLIRSVVDGDQFLGTFTVNKPARRLVLIDNELSAEMVRDWLLKQGIRNTDAVADVICLRGEIASFDILNDQRRSEWAKHLRDVGCDYLIFDCLRPVLDALGLDENHDAGKFLTAFDTLLSEAGMNGDSTIVHHMGHTGERSRGDSRIQDWPDAIWKLVRENPDDEFSPRYFSATGRDVEVPQGLLRYNPANRHLTYQAVNRSDARKQRRADAAVTAIRQILAADRSNGGTGVSQNQLVAEVMKATGIGKPAVTAALDLGVSEGALIVFSGPNRSKNYLIATEMPIFNV